MKEQEGHTWRPSSRRFTGGWECSKCGVLADQPNLKLSPKLKVRRKKGSLTKSPSLVLKPTKKGMELYEYYSCEEWTAIQDVDHVHGL